jgi:hypothetical protein
MVVTKIRTTEIQKKATLKIYKFSKSMSINLEGLAWATTPSHATDHLRNMFVEDGKMMW